MIGTVFNIQHFSLHDGPGIRSTVFFKGCNLRCFWCHNPESWSPRPQIQFYQNRCIGCRACVDACVRGEAGKRALFTDACTDCGSCAEACMTEALRLTGKERTVEDVMAELARDGDIYASSNGGITFSGGEPMLQPDFLRALLEACRKLGWHTAVESAVCVPWETVGSILPLTDLMICDVKTVDDEAHRKATGRSNALILENVRRIAESGAPLLLRTPIIPEFNDGDADIAAIAEFIATLRHRPSWELLPFRDLCKSKYESLNRPFGADKLETPKNHRMDRLREIAEGFGIHCTVNGIE